jgi:hypothetical protein
MGEVEAINQLKKFRSDQKKTKRTAVERKNMLRHILPPMSEHF